MFYDNIGFNIQRVNTIDGWSPGKNVPYHEKNTCFMILVSIFKGLRVTVSLAAPCFSYQPKKGLSMERRFSTVKDK